MQSKMIRAHEWMLGAQPVTLKLVPSRHRRGVDLLLKNGFAKHVTPYSVALKDWK